MQTVFDNLLTLIGLLNPIHDLEDAWGRATKDATYDGRWQQPAPPSNCAAPGLSSFSTVCLWVLFGRSLLLFPSGALVSAVLMFELLSFQTTGPNQFQHLPWIVLGSGIVAVLSYSCWFDILPGQHIFKILRRHFRWNASSFSLSKLPMWVNVLIWMVFAFLSGHWSLSTYFSYPPYSRVPNEGRFCLVQCAFVWVFRRWL